MADAEVEVVTPVEPVSEGFMVGGAMMLPTQTLVENASAADNLTTLVGLIQQAGLVETLSGEGPFTVFAPPNTAFDAVPEETLQPLTLDENKDQLTSVLTYHVVPGRYLAADLQDGQELTTVNGATLTVTMENGNVLINGATVIIPNIEASNGVAHAIDAVLLPPM
jgi:uncharacterized surface protein with fasciclin (FAS1) repeats